MVTMVRPSILHLNLKDNINMASNELHRRHVTAKKGTSSASNSPSTAASHRTVWKRLPSTRSLIIRAISCVAVIAFCLPRVLSSSRRRRGDAPAAASNEHNCWLKRALAAGDFHLFSHRSYHDSALPDDQQPTCREALARLRDIGVNHLDLDVVLDAQGQLIVAHPLEFKHESERYAPCALESFDDVIRALREAYGNDFFVSVEPKAAWGRTSRELTDVALTNTPSMILEALWEHIVRHDLAGRCGAIVELDAAQDARELERERRALERIHQHCRLLRGVRLADPAPADLGGYDYLMPTIEFHPAHVHNAGGRVVPRNLWNKAIFWVVDDEADLALAASLRPFGIVSNSPRNIVEIVEGPGWCQNSRGQ